MLFHDTNKNGKELRGSNVLDAIVPYVAALLCNIAASLMVLFTQWNVIWACIIFLAGFFVVVIYNRWQNSHLRKLVSWARKIKSLHQDAGRLLHEITRVKTDEPESKTLDQVAEIELREGQQRTCTMTASLALESSRGAGNAYPLVHAIATNLYKGSEYCYFVPHDLAEDYNQFRKRVSDYLVKRKPNQYKKREEAMNRLSATFIEPLFSPCDMVAYYEGKTVHEAYLYHNKTGGGALAMRVREGNNKIGAAIEFLSDRCSVGMTMA